MYGANQRRAVLDKAAPCRIMPCSAARCLTMPYGFVQVVTLRCRTLPCNVVRYRKLPCGAIREHAIHATLPYHTVLVNNINISSRALSIKILVSVTVSTS